MTLDGWWLINFLTVLSKVIKHVYLHQMTQHLEENNLIGSAHHSAVKYKSSQTLVTKLHDLLIDYYTHNHESVLMIIDQSKAYDIVSHKILLDKLGAIGYQPQAISIMRNYMKPWWQFVKLAPIM